MNKFIYIITIIISITYASINPEYYPESIHRESKPIIKAFNYARGDFDLPQIIYDYQMAYESKNDVTFNTSFVGCSNKSQIEPFIKKVRRQEGWHYLFSYKGSLRRLINNDEENYDPFDCSKTSFNNYLTCYSDRQCKSGVYPRTIIRSLVNIASVRVGRITYVLGRYNAQPFDSPFF